MALATVPQQLPRCAHATAPLQLLVLGWAIVAAELTLVVFLVNPTYRTLLTNYAKPSPVSGVPGQWDSPSLQGLTRCTFDDALRRLQMSMAWVKAHLATGGKTIIALVTVQVCAPSLLSCDTRHWAGNNRLR